MNAFLPTSSYNSLPQGEVLYKARPRNRQHGDTSNYSVPPSQSEFMQSKTRQLLQRIRRLGQQLMGRDVWFPIQERLTTERHGSEGGDWVVASDHLSSDSIVYSVGVGSDVSFDLSLIRRYGLQVHAFDPTPRSVAWVETQNLPKAFIFHPVGLAAHDGTAAFSPPPKREWVSFAMTGSRADGAVEAPVRRLKTLMKQLSHDRIDLLKMDIEGAEYRVIQDLIDADLPVKQLLVEFHHRLPGIDVQETRQAVRNLLSTGYRIFAISPRGEEYSFIRSPRI